VSLVGPNVGVVNYGIGTWTSVVNMLESIGVQAESCSTPETLSSFTHIVLPGVGNFSVAALTLEHQGWPSAIKTFSLTGKPVLGICLGMQLLGEESSESPGKGLGLMRFGSKKLSEEGKFRVPHMGWNTVEIQSDHKIFAGWTDEFRFYFVHSYAVPLIGDSTIGISMHNEPFSSVVAKDNVVGVQFHPEKSHRFGKKLLENFVEMG
jgi:glutamine amidotransferase